MVAPPVSVTATRIDESASRDLAGARVISSQDIERSRAFGLSETLRSMWNVRTRDLHGSPNAHIDMRGFGSFGDQNTLVLRDGLRIREFEQLTVNWSAIPPESIERIEILPASGAVLYGSGATGGTINIVTRPLQPNSRSGYLGAGLGSHDTVEVRAGAGIAGDSVGLRMQGHHYASDNYRDNNRVRIDNAAADVRWTGDTRSLDLAFGADDQRHGLPGVLREAQIAVNRRQAANRHNFATQRGGYLNLASRAALGSGDLVVSFSHRRRETGASFLAGTPLHNNVDTDTTVWTLSPRLNLRSRIGGWGNHSIIGGDFEDWKFDSLSSPAIPGQPHSTQRSRALYAHHAVTFPTRTTVAVGARQQHARYAVNDLLNPGAAGTRSRRLRAWDISLRQGLTPAVHAYMVRGSSFRLPNVNDNFNPVLARVTLLEPQTARNSEIGIEGNTGAVRYRLAAYHFDFDNEIFFDPVTLGSRNRQPTRRRGVELEAMWHAGSSLDLYVNYTYADARFREGQVNGVPIAGKRVPLAPRHLLNAGLGWSLSARTRTDFSVRHVGSSPFDADETNSAGRKIPAYTVADLELSVRSGRWLLNAGVRNVFDRKYFIYGVFTGMPTYSAFPAQERTIHVSAQYYLR